MKTRHYKVRNGEAYETMAARALRVNSSKDIYNIFEPHVSFGAGQMTIWAYADANNDDRIATVATVQDQEFNGTVERATVSTMSREEWDTAYDNAYEKSGTAGSVAYDAHFVAALMTEVDAKWPGREHFFGNEYGEIADEFQPTRQRSTIKAAQAKVSNAVPAAFAGVQGEATDITDKQAQAWKAHGEGQATPKAATKSVAR